MSQFSNALAQRSLPKDGDYNKFRRRKWVWMMAVLDAVLAIFVVGRFFHYVANEARISNTPPQSELDDRISLLWIWFALLAAYVCQLLMAVALIISTQRNDVETVLGNCQLYIYGAHALNAYTVIEALIILYKIFGDKYLQGFGAVFVGVFSLGKAMFRGAMCLVIKYFMRDLGKPTCTCSHNRANHTVIANDMDGNLLPRQSWPSR